MAIPEHLWLLVFGVGLGLIWASRIVAAAMNMGSVAEISQPEYDAMPADATGRVPRVSIIVPARNEAEHVEQALSALLQLDYRNYEIIAVNDRSSDATGAIMDRLAAADQHNRLRVIHLTELPPGWLGKTHAMWKAGQQASGHWILFTDADVIFRPDALRRAIVYAERERADHLVLFPTMVMHSAGERMMLGFFQSQFVFAHRPWKVADPKARDHMGVGAFNLIRREVYEKLGTYQRLRLAVIDDMKLGELVKRHGFRQRNVYGRDLLQLRWIVGTMGLVHNLTKNFFAILRFNPALTIGALLSMLVINLSPFVAVWFPIGWGARAGLLVALFSIFLIYLGMSWMSDIPPWYFLLHPIGAVLFGYALARSMFLTLVRGGVVWRGTFYSLKELKAWSAGE